MGDASRRCWRNDWQSAMCGTSAGVGHAVAVVKSRACPSQPRKKLAAVQNLCERVYKRAGGCRVTFCGKEKQRNPHEMLFSARHKRTPQAIYRLRCLVRGVHFRCHPKRGRNAIEKEKPAERKLLTAGVVGEDGFEPSKSVTTDLQSAPFGHSGTLPYSIEPRQKSKFLPNARDIIPSAYPNVKRNFHFWQNPFLSNRIQKIRDFAIRRSSSRSPAKSSCRRKNSNKRKTEKIGSAHFNLEKNLVY